MRDFRYLYYLMKTERLGPARIKKLIDDFASAETVFDARFERLTETEGIDEILAKQILKQKRNFNSLKPEYEELVRKIEKIGCNILTYEDENYPELLKTIYDPPIILYYKGRLESDGGQPMLENCIAIVGTRKPTDYGRHIAEVFARELSALGITVVSGFARGIDSIVHKTVLDKKQSGGKTAAVFGCGIDVVYPPENRKLYETMTQEGLMLSEYDPGTGPDAGNFPKRNRIISGLSLGVLVIESGKDGGALITARCALDQSREVFAVPGYITSKYSAGTNSLIKNSMAKLVENTEDVLVELRGRLNISAATEAFEKQVPEIELKGGEKLIFDVIYNGSESVDIDSISELTGLNISDCLVNLLNLEFKGIVKQLPGKRFMRVY